MKEPHIAIGREKFYRKEGKKDAHRATILLHGTHEVEQPQGGQVFNQRSICRYGQNPRDGFVLFPSTNLMLFQLAVWKDSGSPIV